MGGKSKAPALTAHMEQKHPQKSKISRISLKGIKKKNYKIKQISAQLRCLSLVKWMRHKIPIVAVMQSQYCVCVTAENIFTIQGSSGGPGSGGAHF